MLDGFDLEDFRKEFEETYEEETNQDDALGQDDEELEQVDEDLEQDDEEVEQDDEDQDDEEEKQEEDAEKKEDSAKKTQTPEENAAFAEMRRKNEALARQAAIVEKAAAKMGMTVDQYIAAVEEQETAQRAEKQGIPVEVLKQLESQKQQLNQLTLEQQRERFFNQVDTVKSKFSLQDDEIKKVFQYIGNNGYIDPATNLPIIAFEDAYKIANFEQLSERKVKEAKQKDLAQKKARQKKSAVPHTNASTTTNQDTDEITDEYVDKQLRKMGISL